MNIRVSKELAQDLEVVSNLLHVNKSEWIKTKLAEETHKEKNRLLMELSTLYAKGMISKKDLEKLTGKEIADEMEFIKKTAIKSAQKGAEHGKKLKRKLRR